MNRFLACFPCDGGYTGLVAAVFSNPRERDAELAEGLHPDAVAVTAARDVRAGEFVQLADGSPVGAVPWVGSQSEPAYRRVLRDVRGATAVEYALIASLVAVASIAFLDEIGFALNSVFHQVGMAMWMEQP